MKVKAKELVKENKWIATHIRLVQRNNTKFLENRTKSEEASAQPSKKEKKPANSKEIPADGDSAKAAKKSSATKASKATKESSEQSLKKTTKKSSKKSEMKEAEKMSDDQGSPVEEKVFSTPFADSFVDKNCRPRARRRRAPSLLELA